MGDLRAPHACTAHKAQSATYKHVFIDLGDIGKCKSKNLMARLLYVACTRASHNVYLYGELPTRVY